MKTLIVEGRKGGSRDDGSRTLHNQGRARETIAKFPVASPTQIITEGKIWLIAGLHPETWRLEAMLLRLECGERELHQ